jgi:hypothetical protein
MKNMLKGLDEKYDEKRKENQFKVLILLSLN